MKKESLVGLFFVILAKGSRRHNLIGCSFAFKQGVAYVEISYLFILLAGLNSLAYFVGFWRLGLGFAESFFKFDPRDQWGGAFYWH
jgi:hypothetical protein